MHGRSVPNLGLSVDPWLTTPPANGIASIALVADQKSGRQTYLALVIAFNRAITAWLGCQRGAPISAIYCPEKNLICVMRAQSGREGATTKAFVRNGASRIRLHLGPAGQGLITPISAQRVSWDTAGHSLSISLPDWACDALSANEKRLARRAAIMTANTADDMAMQHIEAVDRREAIAMILAGRNNAWIMDWLGWPQAKVEVIRQKMAAAIRKRMAHSLNHKSGELGG